MALVEGALALSCHRGDNPRAGDHAAHGAHAAVPVGDPGKATGVARVSLPLTAVEDYVSGAIRAIAWATAIAAVLVIVGAALITRMITRPVRKLTRAAIAIAAGQLGQDGPDIIPRLSYC